MEVTVFALSGSLGAAAWSNSEANKAGALGPLSTGHIS